MTLMKTLTKILKRAHSLATKEEIRVALICIGLILELKIELRPKLTWLIHKDIQTKKRAMEQMSLLPIQV